MKWLCLFFFVSCINISIQPQLCRRNTEAPVYKEQLLGLVGFGNKKGNSLLRPTKPMVDDGADGYYI